MFFILNYEFGKPHVSEADAYVEVDSDALGVTDTVRPFFYVEVCVVEAVLLLAEYHDIAVIEHVGDSEVEVHRAERSVEHFTD